VNRWPMTWRQWTALGIIALLAVASTAGMHSITGDWSFLGPAVLGALIAGIAFVLARRFDLLPGETLALALGLFVLGGVLAVSVVAVGDVPSPASFGDFFDGLIRSWSDLLSAVAPAEMTPRLSVAPYAAAWFGTIVGASLLRWLPAPGAPVAGPLAGLALVVLLTDEDRALSLVVGVAIAVGALLLAFLVDARSDGTDGADRTDLMETTTSVSPHARTIRVALVLVVVAALSPVLGPRLPLADARERYDLRDEVVPPWDPLSVPSPLVQLKAALAAEVENDVVFEVRADTPLTRWPTAAMTSYDGIVWSVADPDDAGSDFRPVSSQLPTPDVADGAEPVTAEVTIQAPTGPWVPVPGPASELRFRVASDATAPAMFENLRTNTIAVPSGLPAGTVYSVTASPAPEFTDEELRERDLDVAAGAVDLDALPPQIRNIAADVTEGIDHGWGQVAAIRDLFRNEGFYDTTTRVPPGHSYYRLAQFLADPDQVVGYEEQYAAAAGLIARIAELPVRVVVGYEIEPERYVDGLAEVRSGDSSAWIEVEVDGVGWIPVSVSPPRSREPQAENAVASQDQVATPNPPPPPQNPPDVDVFTDNELEEPVEEEDENDEDDEVSASGGIGTLGWIAVASGSILALVAAAAGAIILWKQRRTSRRRNAVDPAARVAGAWLELSDRYHEAGVRAPARSTPLEAVRVITEIEPSATTMQPQLVGLARHVDRAAYGDTPPPPQVADSAWRYADEAVHALLAHQTLPRRTRMRVDPRTLLQRDPLADTAVMTPPTRRGIEAPNDSEDTTK